MTEQLLEQLGIYGIRNGNHEETTTAEKAANISGEKEKKISPQKENLEYLLVQRHNSHWCKDTFQKFLKERNWKIVSVNGQKLEIC